MSEQFQLALSLLAVGMSTVFVILALVVGGGKILIAFSNRFARDEKPVSTPSSDEIPVVIITAIVEHITNGKGKISNINKIE